MPIYKLSINDHLLLNFNSLKPLTNTYQISLLHIQMEPKRKTIHLLKIYEDEQIVEFYFTLRLNDTLNMLVADVKVEVCDDPTVT